MAFNQQLPQVSDKTPPVSSNINPKTGNESLDTLVKNYLKWEKIAAHKQHIAKLVEQNDVDQLARLVGKRLTFGTAGIRGRMGPGFSQMNDLVIIQTSQGLASYLLELDSKATKDRGVIIGFDARHNSNRFARLAAIAFLEEGIPVYLCDHIIPTPLIAYGVKHFGCQAGIVVTASHNPKQDNGYKVFWSNGAQILSPHDTGIQEHIMRPSNQAPWSGTRSWQEDLLRVGGSQTNLSVVLPREWDDLLFRIHGELARSYFTYIEGIVGDRREFNQSSSICITYTTMHGVGHMFLSRAFDLAGFEDVFPVELQKKPDPNFSTVRYPNPEENGALDLAFETAKHANSNLILATDPDADRCGAALYDPSSQYRRVLSGNEIGSLLGWWLWHCHVAPVEQSVSQAENTRTEVESEDETEEASEDREQKIQQKEESEMKRKRRPEDCYMISTAVSSKFLKSVAAREKFQFIETLTGFKYMGNIADELITKHNKCVLFAYEEAIGYMVDSSILDKDGISAAIQLAQCSAYLATTYQRTLEQHLDWLYTVYGYHYNINSYYSCSDQAVIREIFQNLQSKYPSNFQAGGHQFRVTRVRDLNADYDSSTPDKRATLPSSSSSFMITFFVDHDISLTIRTSGTEPKIKYYSEIVAKLPPLANQKEALETNNFNTKEQVAAKEAARQRLRLLVQAATERCLRPSHYDLEHAD